MTNNIKISIIGAGSGVFSATVVRDLCITKGLHGSHVCLMDIDQKRLDIITVLAERINIELNAGLTFSKTTDREQALKSADFVINTAQVGGHDWVELQRSMQEKHGYYRGANLHNLGQMAFMLEVVKDMERICPNAWLIQSSNPVFEGCTLMTRETKIKVIGLCHGHYGYRDIAKVLGIEVEHVTAHSYGFNHWIWMTDFRYKGKNAYPLLDEWIETKAEEYWAIGPEKAKDVQMSRAAIHQYKMYGFMPIGDTPRFAGWWYHTDLETKKKWYNKYGGWDSEIGWAHTLEHLSNKVKEVEKVAVDLSKLATDTFKPLQSDEQIVPIINSIVNNEQRIYQVNVPNKANTIKGFPEDLVVECEAVIDGSGVRPIDVPALPRKLVIEVMLPRWHKAECWVEALRQKDKDLLLTYLLYDHRTRSLEQTETLLKEWLAHPKNNMVAKFFV